MKLIELAQKVKENNTEKFGKMSENRIALIIRETLEQINKEIQNTDDDLVRIPKLGNFKIRMIEKEKDAKKVTLKRIIFNPAK